MDAIIRQTVLEEIRCQRESASTSSKEATREPNQRTVSRLSGLLDRIRGQSRGKKRKTDKEHRIQVRWIHYDKKFQFVRRTVAETGSLLILRRNLPQLKN